jgi:pyruvate,orthophosphate dikinase
MTKQLIYPFTFGDMSQKDLLGGKGANLAEMVRIGLPVPPGFTITTHACREYLQSGNFPKTLIAEIDAALNDLEKQTGKKFGGVENPLLVSVRSGAKFSMPGMMETVLNVGMTPEVTDSLADSTGNARFAWDSYRRFIEMFGKIVCDIDPSEFHKVQERIASSVGVADIQLFDVQALKQLCDGFKKVVSLAIGQEFPKDPREHLIRSVEAVFKSWNSERAQMYRRRERIPSDLGTAVNISAMTQALELHLLVTPPPVKLVVMVITFRELKEKMWLLEFALQSL